MSNLIPFQDLQGMAQAIAKSGLFGMKTPEQALALMLVAQAEGQHPASITQDYDIIQGRAARKTHSVLARFQQMGGTVEWHELSDTVADAKGEFYYRVGILIDALPPSYAGKALAPGMTVTGDIVTGSRTVARHILSPLTKFADNTFRDAR